MSAVSSSDRGIAEQLAHFRTPLGLLSGTIGPTDLEHLERTIASAFISGQTIDPLAATKTIVDAACHADLRNPLTREVADPYLRISAPLWAILQIDAALAESEWSKHLVDHVLTIAGATIDRTIYCYVDAETTGDRRKDHVWEFAWSVTPWDNIDPNAPIREYYVLHNEKPCEWTLQNTDYVQVWGDGPPDEAITPAQLARLLTEDLQTYDPRVVHFVGANPGFDRDHAKAIFETYGLPLPWDFHVIDIENLVMPIFNLKHPPSFSQTARLLNVKRRRKKHTAGGDMLLVRDCHIKILKLQDIAAEAVARSLAS